MTSKQLIIEHNACFSHINVRVYIRYLYCHSEIFPDLTGRTRQPQNGTNFRHVHTVSNLKLIVVLSKTNFCWNRFAKNWSEMSNLFFVELDRKMCFHRRLWRMLYITKINID
jgi:hypothetical protein